MSTILVNDNKGRPMLLGVELLSKCVITYCDTDEAKIVIHTPFGDFFSNQTPNAIHNLANSVNPKSEELRVLKAK